MLTLIEGGFTSVAHDELVGKIKNSIASGKRAFLFVPEQQTLSAEKEMCDALPPSAALTFEVTNFTRFTNTAFRTLGGISGEYITSAGRSLVMWGVLTELSPMLTLTHGSDTINAGTVSKALAAVSELSGLGIRIKDIEVAYNVLGEKNARLKDKLRDLSLIYALYKEKLGEKYADMSEDTQELAAKLYESPDYLADTDIYIEGFTSFTEPQLSLIEAMIALSHVTVSLCMSRLQRHEFEYTEVTETEDRLRRIAGKRRVETRIQRPDSKKQNYNPVISEIASLLWQVDGVIDNESLQILDKNAESVRIFEAANPFDECDFIAADIKRRVMAGAKYRDFAIVARSLPLYSGILDTALDKAALPHFTAEKKSVTSFEAIKLISTAYSAVIKGFPSVDVMTYAKCGLAGISREECDLLELYVTKWRIEGERFADGSLWNMNPDGYTEAREGCAETLIEINSIKDRLITPLVTLRDDARRASTVREHAEVLLDYLLEIDLEGALSRRSRELSERGEIESAEQNSRLWGIICDSLDTVVDILGDTPADTESFYNQLSVVFREAGMGSIPSFLDEISIGQADTARFNGKRHVYMLGVNLGEFPMTVSESSYFTDRDKLLLRKTGLGISPDLEVKNARELYSFSRAFTLASETVTLLYTRKTASLGASLPSEAIGRIKDITCGRVTPRDVSELPATDRIYSPEQALEELGRVDASEREGIRRALCDSEYSHLLAISEGKLENDEVTVGEEAMAIILGNNIYLSQSKIDKYMKCPLRFFASSYMKLRETETAEINQLVVGNFIHSVLEGFFGEMIKSGRSPATLSDKERDALTEASARRYVDSSLGGGYGSARADVIIDRVKRVSKPIVDGLCDEFANCRFTPLCCELHIDSYTKDTPDSIVYDTNDKKHKVIIDGYIDRVDTLKVGNDVYVRVIDYKTGIKKFSLSDIEKGENLQMLLYLKAVVESQGKAFRERLGVGKGGEVIPAGIVYVKTSVADVTVDRPSDELAYSEVKASFERLGASLDDEQSLAAMNPDYTPKKKTKKGEPDVPLTYTKEEWEQLNEQMKTVVLNITDEITSGHITTRCEDKKSPFSPCSDCQFKYVCRS